MKRHRSLVAETEEEVAGVAKMKKEAEEVAKVAKVAKMAKMAKVNLSRRGGILLVARTSRR